MDQQVFIDRILETENLTDELEDAEANWLLKWGTNQLDGVLQGFMDANADADAAGDKVNALMAVMRKINRIAGSAASKDTQTLAEDLVELKELYAAAFGPLEAGTTQPLTPDVQATQLRQIPVQQMLERMVDRSWVTGFKA